MFRIKGKGREGGRDFQRARLLTVFIYDGSDGADGSDLSLNLKIEIEVKRTEKK